ncbi:MAG: hypothetical protein KGL12_00655 [Rhodospirillales bacterium]|nr:hypothetical protein [Rhodospirillales bacterium]
MREGFVAAGLRFAPLLPLWLLVVLAALAGAALLVGLARRARGLLWRAGCFALLLAWLAGPMLVTERRQPLPDIGLLLIDHSASMRLGARAALADTAEAQLHAAAARHPGLILRPVAVGDSPDGGTRLLAALEAALADIPPARFAGTIAISDGMDHDAAARIAALARHPPGGAPFSLLIPAAGEETDRSLSILSAPAYGIVGKSVTLRYVVHDWGRALPAGERVAIRIRRDGELPVRQSVPIGAPAEITLPITRAGRAVVEIAAAPLAGEASTLNDRAVVTIEGVRDRLRVLLVSGRPNPGERAWRRLLKSDPAVDLVHFTILRPPGTDDRTPLSAMSLIAFPVQDLFVRRIGSFDLIVLDRFADHGLLPMPYLANIAARVRAGGALLMSVGPEFAGPDSLAATPLASVLPALPAPGDAVRIGAFRPLVTALGQRHPVTAGLPGANPAHAQDVPPRWGSWYRAIATQDVVGKVLMRTPEGAPLLVLRHAGKGRSALLLSDQIWLWARGHQGGGPQAELLRRVAHWLMREPALAGNALDATIADGVLHIARRSTAPAPAQPLRARVTAPDGHESAVVLQPTAPGRQEARLPAPLPGVWQVALDGQHAYAGESPGDALEFADLRATATRLGGLARGSGGAVDWLAGPDGHAVVPRLRRVVAGAPSAPGTATLWRRGAYRVEGARAEALLPAWLALLLGLAALAMAWWREGR